MKIIREEFIGPHHLIQADCRDVLEMLRPGSFDAVITDPPYGIDFASNHVARRTTASWMRKTIANDSDLEARDFVLGWHGGAFACFGSQRRAAPQGTRGILVWDKGPASGMGDLSFPWKPSFEMVFIGGSGWSGHRDEGVIKGHWIVTRVSMGRVHPNEKPVSLMQAIVKKAPGCTVVDPFMGSCATGVACAKLGREFTGIEIDPDYFEIACQRMEAVVSQPDMFVPDARPEPVQEGFAL